MTFTPHPVMPVWLIALIAAALTSVLIHGSVTLLRKKVPVSSITFFAALRLIIIALFIVCLLRPTAAFEAVTQRYPDLIVLYDTSASMNEKAGESDTRFNRALQAMQESGLSERLQTRYDLHPFTFDRTARPIILDDLTAVEANGTTTDLADSVRAAWNYYRQGTALDSISPADILLVTDGIELSTSDVIDSMRSLGAKVHTLSLPEQLIPVPPSVAISGVQAPRHVLLGAECELRAAIDRTGDVSTPLVLELLEDDQRVAEYRLTFNPGETQRKVSLSHLPTSIGAKRYSLRLSPVDDAAALPAIEPYELTVDVEGRTNNVLVLEDTWRWEFKYLRRVLENDPNFALTALLSRGPGAYAQFTEPDRTANLAGFPQSQTDLDRFNILILGDVRPERWPPDLAAALYSAVVEEGKSLIVIAGPNLNQWAASPQLEPLLPVVLGPNSGEPVGPLTVRPSEEGAASSLFHASTLESEGNFWDNLPTLDHIYAPLRKRPAATILLEAPEQVNEFGNLIVMAEHTVGRGRVLYIGTDTLWHWQTLGISDNAGNTPHQLFWQHALRAMAPRRWIEGSATLWLDTDRSRYVAGEAVQLTAALHSDRSLRQPQIEASVTMPDGRVLPLMMNWRPESTEPFQGSFEVGAPGHYTITAVLRSEGKTVADTTTAIDVSPAPDEKTSRPVATELLQRIAATTGGNVVDPENPETWPAPSDPQSTIKIAKTVDLWNNFTLMLVLVGLLGMDWLLRLLRGFV